MNGDQALRNLSSCCRKLLSGQPRAALFASFLEVKRIFFEPQTHGAAKLQPKWSVEFVPRVPAAVEKHAEFIPRY